MGFIKRLLFFVLIILLLALLSIFYPYLTGQSVANSNSPTDYSKETIFVSRVIDGDTFKDLNGTSYRLLGINTPEKNKPFYQEAKDFLTSELENKSIELLRDTEDTDRYERKLRYVFSKDKLINVEIIQEGYATTFMLDGLKYKDKFVNAEIFARNNGIGMWKKSKNNCASCIILVNLEPIQDFFIIKNICSKNCNLSDWIIKDDANHFTYLDKLDANQTKEYKSKLEIWNDSHDRFFMRDNKGDLVVFYEY